MRNPSQDFSEVYFAICKNVNTPLCSGLLATVEVQVLYFRHNAEPRALR